MCSVKRSKSILRCLVVFQFRRTVLLATVGAMSTILIMGLGGVIDDRLPNKQSDRESGILQFRMRDSLSMIPFQNCSTGRYCQIAWM